MKRQTIFYYGKKFVIFLISVWLLSVLVFYMARLAPGEPLMSYYGERVEKMSVEEKEIAREKLGLDAPIYVQYGKWLKNALKGDFGISYKYKQDVLTVIGERIGNTLLLGGLGYILIFFGALGLGVLCAWHEETWLDKLLCKIGTVLSCIPEFWMALVCILIFSVTFHILPSSGAYDIGKNQDVLNRLWHLLMPLCIVVLEHLWYYAYFVRNMLLEEIRAEYVLLGKSKGLSKKKIMFGHCLRNIMPTYISLMAISIPHILGGTYIVEKVFSYPGIGTLAFESAQYHDYNLLMVLCMMTGIVIIFFNLVGQILNEHMNPRLKHHEIMESTEVEVL